MKAVDYREELIQGLRSAINADAEELATTEERATVSEDDIGRAFLMRVVQMGDEIRRDPKAFLE